MIQRRIVLYIPGYDPRGPRHYHEIYRQEAARQAAINGQALAVGPRHAFDPAETRWTITTPTTTTDYRFLRYDDIMRQRWSRSGPGAIRDICYSFFALLWRGVIWKVAKLSWPFAITLVNGFVLLLAGLLLALAAGAIATVLANWWFGIIAVGLALFGLLALRPSLEQRLGSLWLARTFAFMADQGAGRAADMEARTDIFAARIAAALAENVADEVLVIGHSTGGQIAIAALARALRRADPTSAVSLLTLGHTIPVLALQPGAADFRNELLSVAEDTRVHWIDFTAAIDGACFPMTDPVAASGLTRTSAAPPSPKLLSTRFIKLFHKASYATLKRDFRRAHFQYLMAAEIAGDYDYFLITGGDMSLAGRYAHLDPVRDFNRFRLARQ